MATGRMLQKRISNSRKMAILSADGARLLYTWMLSHLDKNGCFFADPVMVNNIVFTRLGKSHKDVQRFLDELDEAGLIIRYEVDGEQYLQYPDFLDKQVGFRPDREGKTDIPEPDPEVVRISSGLPPQEGEREGEKKEKVKVCPQPRVARTTDECPHKAIIETYHKTLPSLNSVREWNRTRQGLLRTRWAESEERQDLSWWENYFLQVSQSDFLMGRVEGQNGRPPFRADLEWLIRPGNMIKVLEGKYGNGTSGKGRLW